MAEKLFMSLNVYGLSKLVENGFTPILIWQDAVRRYFREAQL